MSLFGDKRGKSQGKKKEKKLPQIIPGIRGIAYRAIHFIARFIHSIPWVLSIEGRKQNNFYIIKI